MQIYKKKKKKIEIKNSHKCNIFYFLLWRRRDSLRMKMMRGKQSTADPFNAWLLKKDRQKKQCVAKVGALSVPQ